jgi:hypothetical protein
LRCSLASGLSTVRFLLFISRGKMELHKPSTEMFQKGPSAIPGFVLLSFAPEANRIQLVLFGMQNRTVGPHLAAIHRILFSDDCTAHQTSSEVWGAVVLHAVMFSCVCLSVFPKMGP